MDRFGRIRFNALVIAVALITLAGLAAPAQAQQADSGSAALAEMLKALTVPGGAGASIGGGAGAGVDQQVNALTGSPQLTQEVYALAGQILTELMQSSGGDMNKLSDTLKRAQTDPAGFVDSLSPQTRDRLRELSDRIAAARK